MVSFTALNNSQHFINLKKEENAIEANGLKVYLKINNLETSRLGINISSKGTNAVNRNKFKRRIKEAVRGLKIEINVDIYVIGSNQSSDISLKDIKEILISHPKLKTK
ncbi:MAG: ribonuclease P protein component [Candidatus Actinomarina sp.]|nr:ribonuclease P protein component [Candidatus Actinomarina sp.]